MVGILMSSVDIAENSTVIVLNGLRWLSHYFVSNYARPPAQRATDHNYYARSYKDLHLLS